MEKFTTVQQAVKELGNEKTLKVLNGYLERVARIRAASTKRVAIYTAFKKMSESDKARLLSA